MKAFALILIAAAAWARAPAPAQLECRGGRGSQGTQVVSPEVTADKKVIIRILAPNAQSVKLASADMPRAN